MDHLYIRHTVGGRLFYDSKLHGSGYTMETKGRCTVFTLLELDEAIAAGILQFREELNLFLVSDGEHQRKSWFYPSRGELEYGPALRTLRIHADVRHDYSVDQR